MVRMNPFSDLFRRPPTVQECALPPERRVNDDGRVFIVVACWPDRKITYEKSFRDVGEIVTCALAAGATSVTAEPEWQGARLVAS